ncbi:hypothetical protein [Devosia sp.]|uniref:hypothetical protein n=1 Tax=Devosia sp. TaxID=1871048 RepID=UPI0035B0D548
MTAYTTQATDTLTIVANTIEEVMAQFQERRLAEAGYVIVGPARRQQFTLGHEPLFAGAQMVAATFARTH